MTILQALQGSVGSEGPPFQLWDRNAPNDAEEWYCHASPLLQPSVALDGLEAEEEGGDEGYMEGGAKRYLVPLQDSLERAYIYIHEHLHKAGEPEDGLGDESSPHAQRTNRVFVCTQQLVQYCDDILTVRNALYARDTQRILELTQPWGLSNPNQYSASDDASADGAEELYEAIDLQLAFPLWHSRDSNPSPNRTSQRVSDRRGLLPSALALELQVSIRYASALS